jgi:type VI secretion system secreted protein Hcp
MLTVYLRGDFDIMKKSLVACVLAAAFVFSSQASAGLSSFLVLQGPKGKINGGVIQKGREGWIEVIGAEHRVTSTNGGRTHSTFVITKEVDVSTPKLYQAMITNDTLDVTFNFFAPNKMGTAGGGGAEMLYYTVKLTKARIVDIKFKQPLTKDADSARLMEMEEVAFNYQDITWTFNGNGGSSATDTKKN